MREAQDRTVEPDPTIVSKVVEVGNAQAQSSPANTSGVVVPVSYLPDDAEDKRKCAPEDRRCAATVRDGTRCRSYSVRGEALCGGHLGLGLAASPVEHARRSHEVRRHMKLTRQIVAPSGRMGPRAALRMEALRNGAALADRVVSAALDPGASPVAAGNLALRVIESVDPPIQAAFEVEMAQTLEEVEALSFKQLLALAARLGIETPAGSPASGAERSEPQPDQ